MGFKINVVSTAVKKGKGGISTALVGYKESDYFSCFDVSFLCSHDESHKLLLFFNVAKNIVTDSNKDSVYWFHCAQWVSLIRKLSLAVLVKLKRRKVFFHFHSAKISDYFNSKWKLFLIGIMLRFADGIVVLTPWWRELFLNEFPFMDGKIHVSPNPLDSKLEQAARNLEVRSCSDKVRILAMSRLVKDKGFQSVIKALEFLPDNYELVIAGDGPYESALRSLVLECGFIDRVTFLGWVPYEEKSELLKKCDVFCLPSKFDSFGMCFIEAMAFGMPVVALNYQATPDVVLNGKTGILCDSSAASEIANAVLYCVNNKIEMGKQCKSYVLKKYISDHVSSDLISFFKSS
ncbi:glycosyltransferase family 4 protein [Shewanella algae]|uniref:glycosyltransferase family 4 protein n=1 Tax=Shewanella algae TaxID=38313 RepID=UPI001C57FEBD|nr:glycosyltransferase family 4 protein [Shewanella algae]